MSTLLAISILFATANPPPPVVTTYLVDRTTDALGGVPLDGTLRAALWKAAQSRTDDVIVFDGSLSGQTIRLVTCLPAIKGHVELDATALRAPLELDASAVSGCAVFDFSAGNGTIDGPITLEARGASAAAMRIGAGHFVEAANITVRGFRARLAKATIENSGILKLSSSVMEKNEGSAGGAISTMGPKAYTRLRDVSLIQNNAKAGGAMFQDGGLISVINSRLEANAAMLGAAIRVVHGAAWFEHSTIIGNVSAKGAAIDVVDGTVYLIRSHIEKNGNLDCRITGAGGIQGLCPSSP